MQVAKAQIGILCEYIAGYQSTAAVCDPQVMVVGAIVYHSYDARLFTPQRQPRISEYAEQKITEQNLVYAAINLK